METSARQSTSSTRSFPLLASTIPASGTFRDTAIPIGRSLIPQCGTLRSWNVQVNDLHTIGLAESGDITGYTTKFNTAPGRYDRVDDPEDLGTSTVACEQNKVGLEVPWTNPAEAWAFGLSSDGLLLFSPGAKVHLTVLGTSRRNCMQDSGASAGHLDSCEGPFAKTRKMYP